MGVRRCELLCVFLFLLWFYFSSDCRFLILQHHISIGYLMFQIFSPRSCAFLILLHLVRDTCKHLSFRSLVAMTLPYQQWSKVLFLFLHSGWTLLGVIMSIFCLYSVYIFFSPCCALNVYILPKCIYWNLKPQCDGFRGSGRYIGHEDVALMNGISALLKVVVESSLTPSVM